MDNYYPIMLITYNRLVYTKRTVEALAKNSLAKASNLFVFTDAPRTPNDQSVVETQTYVDSLEALGYFKKVTVIKWKENKGVFKSTLDACDYMCNQAEAFIGLEDDIDTHPYFLQYINDCLNFYKDNPQVGAVLGFCYQTSTKKVLKNYRDNVLFSPSFHSYGWGCWANRWKKVDISMHPTAYFQRTSSLKDRIKFCVSTWFYGLAIDKVVKANSSLWDVRFCFYLYFNNMVCVWPKKSFTRTFGFDGSGLHAWTFPNSFCNFEFEQNNETPLLTHTPHRSFALDLKMSFAIGLGWVQAFVYSSVHPIAVAFRGLF